MKFIKQMKIVVCILITTSILCGDFGCIYASETKIITQSNTEIDKNKEKIDSTEKFDAGEIDNSEEENKIDDTENLKDPDYNGMHENEKKNEEEMELFDDVQGIDSISQQHSEENDNESTSEESTVDVEDPLYSKYYDENGNLKNISSEDISIARNAANPRGANQILGCDVSYFQGNIDWYKAKRMGIDFAFIRIGYRRRQSGEIVEDAKYKEYIAGAQRAGIKVGAYFFSEAINDDEARQEAEFMVSHLKNYDLEMPVAIDYEGFNNEHRVWNAGLTKEQHTNIIKTFCNYVKDRGYVPSVYSSTYYFLYYIDGKILSESYNMWVASWGIKPEDHAWENGTRKLDFQYDCWQYSSDGNGQGAAYGVESADIDLDYWYTNGTLSNGEYSVCDGIYTISSNLNKNMVLDIPYGSGANGANVQLYQSNGSNAQKFKIKHLGKGLYSITNLNSNKVLDVFNNWTKNGTNIQQYGWNNSFAQKWIIKSTGDGYYNIVSPVSNKVLDVAYASTANGANIQLYQNNGSMAQKFKLNLVDRTTPIENGVYSLNSAADSTKVVDISCGSLANKGNVHLYNKNNSNAQKFIISKIGSGYYAIFNVNSGKALEATGWGNGANVVQNQYVGSDRQKWILRNAGNGYYYIISAASGNYLDIAGGYTTNGTNIQVYSPNGSVAQKYKFINTQPIGIIEGNYYLTIAGNNKYTLDVYAGSKNNYGNIQVYSLNKTKAQQFKLVYRNDGFYSIENVNSQRVLDVYAGSRNNGANVQQYSWNGSNAQKWILRKNINGTYTFINAGSGKALDIHLGYVKNGANVQQYDDNGSNAQKFVLKKVD